MISTDLQRVQIQDVVEHQLPAFVRTDFPLIADFLKQYYISQEYPGASADLIQNIDEYLKLESLTNNRESTTLAAAVGYDDTTLTVTFDLGKDIFGTYEFPEKYGLLKINDEIILYTGKTTNSFTGCIRGFSGVTSYTHLDVNDRLTFKNSQIATHKVDATVTNLSALLFNQFLTKIKYQITPGFEDRKFDSSLDQRLFISRAKDFYETKGTDQSFKILFGALYGEDVEVIKPREFLFRPSDAQYRVTKDLVVEAIAGDPSQLLNRTLKQDAYPGYGISESYASISETEKIVNDGKTYYKISVDYDYDKDIDLEGSLLGAFSVHPKTKVITQVSSGSSIIDVDSTVGFAHSGELVATYSNGTTGIVSYTSKSYNQFFGVTNLTSQINSKADIRLNAFAYGYVGIGTTSKITVRIGSVLSEVNVPEDTYYYTTGDTARIRSLGITTTGARTNCWINNVATKFDVKDILLLDISDYTYRITTYAPNNYRIGDNLIITGSDSVSKETTISDVTDAYTFSIKGQEKIVSSSPYTVERRLLKPDVSNTLTDYDYVEKEFANIQNTYVKFNQDALVAAPSLPFYYQQPLDFYDRQIVLNGSYSGETFTVTGVTDHGYYTGDGVYYNRHVISTDPPVYSEFSEMEDGLYLVKRVNGTQFKLATSQANLYNESYVSVSGIVTSNTLTYIDYHDKSLQQQQLLREIIEPDNESGDYITDAGKTGILINGVEILNYKADDTIYAGRLDGINVSAPGKSYDIINPPVLSISDDVGVGATGKVAVKGSLERIEIIDPGFDYIDTPLITITGGNGEGATASVNTKSITHSVSFDSTATGGAVDLTTSSIGFSTYHKFANGEKVFYRTDSQTAVGGISTDAIYYVETIDTSTIKLYTSEGEALVGLTTVSLTSFGVGVQRIQSFSQKQIISNIGIDNDGSGYENKERTALAAGINTASNEINIINHGYQSQEIVEYTYDTTQIEGLNSDTQYIVTKVDDNNFKLSSVGVGSTAKFFYSDNELYIDFTTQGAGNHTFNYEPITVSLTGEIGVTTTSGQNFQAQLQPIFRGEIDSVQVTSTGVGYGASEIFNYNRQPSFTLLSGEDAELLPIVNNGQIVEVLVTVGGNGYNSPPDLTVNGAGKYAKLVPVLSGGSIVSVRVDSPGMDYTDDTTVTITASGLGARFEGKIQKWTVNYFQKYLPIISSDDGILDGALNEELGIEYTALYAPRPLRESIYGRTQDNVIKYGVFDLQRVNDEEVSTAYHSPIIGWAYDGNPIYGPYGFTSPTGGTVKAMESGYGLVSNDNRPPLSLYPQGFFVEDHSFDNSGDLDEHNGRFGVTPDYPNGTYAYFATINPGPIENSGAFQNYKIPVFPYLIGNSFKSKPNPFNFKTSSSQIEYDINSSQWLRNTTPYALTETYAYYDFLFQPNKAKVQTIDITATSTGTIDAVGILTGGSSYQVGDKVNFEVQRNTQSAKAKVSKILGELITEVSVATTSVPNLEIVPFDSNGSYIAFATAPHSFTNNDLVSLVGFNTSVNSLQDSFNIGISTQRFTLTTAIDTDSVTGIVTYIDVAGRFNNDLNSVRSNDILGVGLTEKVKVLNVDVLNSRLRVLRSQEGTTSTATTATSSITEELNKFSFTALPEDKVTFELNKEIYFKPSEALGLSVTGIGTTISFVNPGAGLTQVFIPSQSIYLPNHELKSGDILTYHNNTGNSIAVSTDATTSFSIPDSQPLYVGKISNDLIGISTFLVGVGSTGTFVGIASTTGSRGLLYFTGIGTKDYHSFRTVKENVVTAEANKNTVTVATASTHGLQIADTIDIKVKPVSTSTVTVKYNDFNRRIVFNPKAFVAGDVDIVENTITISDHGWSNGEKVIHTATSPSGGLSDEGIYYVVRYSKDKIKLCNSKYETTQFNPAIIDITSASAGTLSPVNPAIDAYKNQSVSFDLSDPSLSTSVGISSYSAFSLDLYTDSQYRNKFESTSTTTTFEVEKTGEVGKTSNAALTLRVSNGLPDQLFYKFTPINESLIEDSKKEIYIDTEVSDYNQIEVGESVYSGTFNVIGIAGTTFTYNLTDVPEVSSYTSITANSEYTTTSPSVYGSIAGINLNYKGTGYESVVGISTIVGVSTTPRSGAILQPSSTTIGKINSVEIENIGFDYPVDNTLRPVLNLPEILDVEPLTSFASIGITSAGKDYSIAPALVVIDGYTQKQVPDVDLTYEIGDTSVTIIQNTKGIYNTQPTIIPINNVNGVGIASVTYDISDNSVSVGLDTGFSSAFPFNVGDKVLVESVSVGVGSTGYGYNSSNYGYSLFTLSEVFPNLGGVGIVTFSLDGYLPSGQYPGLFDAINSAGRIIPEKDFPQFNINLTKNQFLLGETVTSGTDKGVVESWDSETEILKVSSLDEFDINTIILGQTSRTQGNVKGKIDFNSDVELDATSVVKKGWKKDTGFLNYNTERLSDNNYYQNFSYALKSKVDFDTWEDPVTELNHTAGFVKFSDLMIESSDEKYNGVFSNDAIVDVTVDVQNVIDVDCYSSFDLVTENSLLIGSQSVSDEIYLNSRVLTDYYESIGNRVLLVDDVSGSFNSDPRSTSCMVVDRFPIGERYKKYFTYVRDQRYTDQRQFMIVSLLHTQQLAYMNQYARVDSGVTLGSFDWSRLGGEGELTFCPVNYKVNDYNVSHASISLVGLSTLSPATYEKLGTTVSLSAAEVDVAAGTATTIVGIASTYRSSKVLVEIDADNGLLEFDELNVIHDDSTVDLLEYGQLVTSPGPSSGTGLGTYSASMSSGTIDIMFHPNAGVAATVNTMRVSIADTATGIGTTVLGVGDQDIAFLDSRYTSIASTTAPTANTIARYSNSGAEDHNAAYYLVQVADTTNNRYEFSEVAVLNDSSTPYITEWGTIDTAGALGSISVSLGSTYTDLTYTPNASIDTEVRVFQIGIQLVSVDARQGSIVDLNTWSVGSGYGYYTGTETDVKRAFNLDHNQRPIFLRNFDGSDSSIVNLTDNTITIPEHYFVTGEEVTYTYGDTAIGIATTTFSGIGSTSFVPPSSVYIVDKNDTTIQLARSAEDALATTPLVLDLTTVGVGTLHTFTCKNPNTKALIALDNAIQSPIVSTATTTGLTSSILLTENKLELIGVTSFFGGDLVQVDDEIMKITTVGLGSTNHVLVDRGWMGTGIATHATNSIVYKVEGNYNIVDSTLNFYTAPHGPTPIGSSSYSPDNRDWVGITTHSTFQGRTFMRSGSPNGSEETYLRNYLFDDIADQFDAITKTFTLESDNTNIAGFSTNNSIILVNGVFQGPTGDLSVNQDYDLTETSGITSITFTGTATSLASDPQNATIPVGGIIVSVGSTGGFGYQPLVSAGGTVVVSSAGTVSSIAIGNSGSGYRVGVQTTVHVAIQTSSLGIPNLTGVGTAQITDGNITGIAITNGQVFYAPVDVSTVGYTSTSGLTTVTTSTAHNLGAGDEILLSGIAFTCEYSAAKTITDFLYDNTTGVATVTTSGAHGYAVDKEVLFTGIGMTCELDAGASTHTYPRTTDPYYLGSTVNTVVSTTKFEVNVGVSTVPTFYQSGGTVMGCVIAPRVSDPAEAGSSVIRIVDATTFETNTGVSTRHHLYNRGGKVNKPLEVIIDEPLSYSDIPLYYSDTSAVGLGTEATIDIVVGQGSSIIDFTIKNTGYNYGQGQILTVPLAGTTGIPTDTSLTFEEFQITIQRTQGDSFAGWNVGELLVLDKIDSQFDDNKRKFTIEQNGSPLSILSATGSNINVEATLLVFLNDIIQVPGEGYDFPGGSTITFAAAPKAGDTCKILFYKGSGDVDVTFKDVLETVKKGDNLTIQGDSTLCANSVDENKRLVTTILSSNSVKTNPYNGPGISGDVDCKRSVTWCKQKVDKIINGQIVGKARELNEAWLFPTTNLIQSVGVGSTVAYVTSVRAFFDNVKENQTSTNTYKIAFTSQDNIVGAAATGVVSVGGTISSVVVSYGGTGYTSAPSVTIANPVGLGTTARAEATSTLTGDAVSAITVTTPGVGYTSATPPEVLIEVPQTIREINDASTYSGDFGEIVGITTTTVGVASTGIVFDFHIPNDSILRNTSYVSAATTISSIAVGDYFIVEGSNIGNGVTSLYQGGSVLGIGTTFVDGVYEVAAVSVATTSIPGFAVTYVSRVTASVSSWNGLSGMGYSSFFGEFSWGKIELGGRVEASSFNAYTQKGIVGITTSAVVNRVEPLKYVGYLTT